MILYGIPTCDTCRKARKALEAAGHEVSFRDVRKEPLSDAEIAAFDEAFGAALVNRRSTTWRDMTEAERADDAGQLLRRYPTLMKRPVVSDGERMTLGWDRTAQSVWIA